MSEAETDNQPGLGGGEGGGHAKWRDHDTPFFRRENEGGRRQAATRFQHDSNTIATHAQQDGGQNLNFQKTWAQIIFCLVNALPRELP